LHLRPKSDHERKKLENEKKETKLNAKGTGVPANVRAAIHARGVALWRTGKKTWKREKNNLRSEDGKGVIKKLAARQHSGVEAGDEKEPPRGPKSRTAFESRRNKGSKGGGVVGGGRTYWYASPSQSGQGREPKGSGGRGQARTQRGTMGEEIDMTNRLDFCEQRASLE